jgi:hypothetical protein
LRGIHETKDGLTTAAKHIVLYDTVIAFSISGIRERDTSMRSRCLIFNKYIPNESLDNEIVTKKISYDDIPDFINSQIESDNRVSLLLQYITLSGIDILRRGIYWNDSRDVLGDYNANFVSDNYIKHGWTCIYKLLF